jgi:hypothetical protein
VIDDPGNAGWAGWASTDRQNYSPDGFRWPWQNPFFRGGRGPADAEVDRARKIIEKCLRQ